MLDNAGNKIVLWSKVVLYLGAALSLAAGIFMILRGVDMPTLRYTITRTGAIYGAGILSGSRLVIAGFLVIVIGSLSSWLCALLLRAFGDLANDTRAIRRQLEYAPYRHYTMKAEMPAEPKAKANPEETAEESAQTKPEESAAPPEA